MDFSPDFDYFLPSIPLWCACFFFSRACRCSFKLVVWEHSNFFMEALSAMNFPLSTAFIVFHKFEYVVASFLLNSRKSLISFFISFLTKLSLSRELFNSRKYVDFLLLSKSSLNSWWSDKIQSVISVYFCACFSFLFL